MTQLDDRDTQPISMPELLSTTATIAMPGRAPVLRDRRVQVVAFVGVAAVVAAFVCLKPFSPAASGSPVVSRPARSAAPTVSQPSALSFPTDGATMPAQPFHAVSAPAAAPSRPPPPATRPVAVVQPPKPSPSPSGSASGSPSPSPSGSGSVSASSSPSPSNSTPEQESSPS